MRCYNLIINYMHIMQLFTRFTFCQSSMKGLIRVYNIKPIVIIKKERTMISSLYESRAIEWIEIQR
jgi:hypothetical protein